MTAPELSPPTPNLPLLRKVLDHIDAHPEEWNQSTFVTPTSASCGTAYCIAGHAAVMSGATFVSPVSVITPDGRDLPVGDYACEVLGLTRSDVWTTGPNHLGLFSMESKRADVQAAAERIAARAGERL